MRPRTGRTRVRAAVAIAVAIALVGLAGGLLVWTPDGIEEELPPVPVLVRPVELLSLSSTVVVSGEIESRHSVDVGFQVQGRVATVRPEEGDTVEEGEVLATVEPDYYRLELERALAALEHADDALRRARAMDAARGVAPAELAQLETAHRAARAQADLARKRIADTRLVAPRRGLIARRAVEPGAFAAPGVPVFTIVTLDPVQVRVGVPEASITMISPGQRAAVSVPSVGGERFEGTVRQVGVTADPVSRTYTVRIDLPNPTGRFRPGMIAEAAIDQGDTRRVLTVPGEAVVRTPEGVTVLYVLDGDGQRAHARRVVAGTVYGREVEILSGISEGDVVVVGGQHRLFDGAGVEARVETRQDG